MRLSVYGVLLLVSSRLFATVAASAGCDQSIEFPTPSSTQSGDSQASASASCHLTPIPGYTSIGTAQSDVSLVGSSASITVSQSAAHAFGSINTGFALLVTGGTGTGKYMLLGGGSYSADYSDTAYYDIELGSTQLYGQTDSFSSLPIRVTNLYGTFTYGVLDILPFTMQLAVGEFASDRRAGNASATFHGIAIMNDDLTPNSNAVFSFQQTPEPSFGMTIGLCLLAVAGWKTYGTARTCVRPTRS